MDQCRELRRAESEAIVAEDEYAGAGSDMQNPRRPESQYGGFSAWSTRILLSGDGEGWLPPRRCSLQFDAIDPFDPPVAPSPGRYQA